MDSNIGNKFNLWRISNQTADMESVIMGVIVIGMIPVLILFFAFQKYFYAVCAATGIK